MKFALMLLSIVGLIWRGKTDFQNSLDHPLSFRCPHQTQTISRIFSVHNNHAEDRTFSLSCVDILPNATMADIDHCGMTPDYVNAYDELVHYSCPTNYYMNGMNSVHDNHHEDRRWRFYCCNMADLHLADCSFSGWTNIFDNVKDFHVPTGHVLKGVISRHDNHKEDRRFEYEYCRFFKADKDLNPVG